MTSSRRNPAAGVALGLALAALAATPARSQSQDTARTIANGESIVIDGRTFSITPGPANLANAPEQRRARRFGAGGVIIFRRGDGLYMVDRASPPTATTAAPRRTTVDCAPPSALQDQSAQVQPIPNEPCQQASGAREMERQRPSVSHDAKNAADDIEHMDENPRIHTAYLPPTDSAQKQVYDTVRQRHVLETVGRVFSPWDLGDIDLNIRTMSCGFSNAYYQQVDHVPTVTICYEYLQAVWQAMPEEMRAMNGDSMKDVVCGQLFFAIAHELGHAMFDIFDVPVFGRQEDAADEFATYNILQFGGNLALQLIDGAAYAYHVYVKDLATRPQVTLPFAAFSSDHGAPEQRYFNLICIAYGYDPRLFSLEMDKIPPARAKQCKYEYEDLKFAMRTVFWPHIDQEKAKRVMAMQWYIHDGKANTPTTTK